MKKRRGGADLGELRHRCRVGKKFRACARTAASCCRFCRRCLTSKLASHWRSARRKFNFTAALVGQCLEPNTMSFEELPVAYTRRST